MRLVVFSDMHLDTAFAWARPDVARTRRQGLRDTLRRIVALADEVGADALLCGGDLYEHERFTPDTMNFLRTTFASVDIPVYLAPGNHDWLGPQSIYTQVPWSPNVHVFKESEFTPVTLDGGLTLWGAAHRAPANTDGFFDRGFTVDRDGVHLALFHGSERSGFVRQQQEQEKKQPHAPFDAEQIAQAGIHHAFLGHYHRPSHTPTHTYPGNPEPLTFGEDDDRGAVIADVAADGTVTCEWRVVASSQVHDVRVDVTGAESRQELRDRTENELAGLRGTARLTVTGELHPDVELDLEELETVPSDLDQVVVRARGLEIGYDIEAIAEERDTTVRGRFVQDVRSAEDLDDDEKRRIITTGLRALAGSDNLEVV
jgi:DNA repair protein SbcD/Mre11